MWGAVLHYANQVVAAHAIPHVPDTVRVHQVNMIWGTILLSRKKAEYGKMVFQKVSLLLAITINLEASILQLSI